VQERLPVRIGSTPRKRRTRQHVIADLSVNYVERFILEAGHTVQRLTPDYGYDLLLFTHDKQGYVESGMAFLQLKAAETLERAGSDFVFDLDVRDYHRWMFERYPVLLILFDARQRRAYWSDLQRYFRDDPVRRPEKQAKTIRVRVPVRQVVNRRGVTLMRDTITAAAERLESESDL
jgi:hypothetical protein